MKSYSFILIFLSCIFLVVQEGYSQTYSKNPGTRTSMHARQLPPQLDDHSSGSAGSSLNSATTSNDYLGPEGSMYYNENWQDGKVMLADNSLLDDIQLRYNVYFKQMQFIRQGDTAAFANPEELKYILLGDNKFIYSDYITDHQIGNDYFQVLTEGECMLLHRNLVKYHEVINKIDCVEEKFIRCCELYIKHPDQPAKFVKCNKRSVCQALNDDNGEIEQFIEDNGMKLKTKEELITVIEFYNSLKEKKES